MKRIGLAPLLVFCNSDTYIFFPGTPWGTTDGAELLREGVETRNMPGSDAMTVTIGLQCCNTINSPDTAVPLTSSRTSDGLTFPTIPTDKSSTTGAKRLCRYGYLVKNTAGSDTTVRFCWVSGFVEQDKA